MEWSSKIEPDEECEDLQIISDGELLGYKRTNASCAIECRDRVDVQWVNWKYLSAIT